MATVKLGSLMFLNALFRILGLLCFSSASEYVSDMEEQNELATMKEEWEECCRSNESLCISGSCYSMEWRAAAWAAVRNRCRGRYPRWPFAVDLMTLNEEKDIEVLWKLLFAADPSRNSALPVTVWTSGTRCPQRGPPDIVVSTAWTSNQPFSPWLTEKVNEFPLSNSSSCEFMVVALEYNRTAMFHFEDDEIRHPAVCEFLFPGKSQWTTSDTPTTRSHDCTDDVSTCEEENDSTLGLIPSTDNTTGSITLTQSVTMSVNTNSENTLVDDKNGIPSTHISYEYETTRLPTETRTTEAASSFSTATDSFVTTANRLKSTEVSVSTTTASISTSTLSSRYSSTHRSSESETVTRENLNSMGCKEQNASGIQWPVTPPGEIANQSCPDGMTGYAQWKCDEKTLTFVPRKPSIHHCRHIWIDKLEDEINAERDAVEISSKLANKTKDSTLSHGDISAVVQLAENLMKLFTRQKQEKESENELTEVTDMTYDFTKSFVATYSNVLKNEHNNAWSDLPEAHQRIIASKILRHTETVGQVLSCVRMSPDNVQYTVLEDNINLQTFMFNSSDKRTIPYVFPELGPEVSSLGEMEVPADLTPDLWPSSCPDAKTAVGIVYKNVGQFLKEESQTNTDSNVGSSILGFTLGNNSTGSMLLPNGLRVSILLKHTVPLNKKSAIYTTSRCVFWNFSKGSSGDWDDSGCHVSSSNFSFTRCTCDHLTNFAILMDVNYNVADKDLVLEMMTYICCGSSIVSLVLTLICLIGIRSMHCRRSTITSNLCASLLVMNVIVVFGLNKTRNEMLCSVIAGFLQYSSLSAFCWMLLEAFQLYQMVILVFRSSAQISMAYIYMFGYGVPSVIVGISAGMRPEDYGGPNFCWLSNENGLMWSFVGPACLIMVVNLIVFVMTLKSASSLRIRKEQKTAAKVKNWVKGSFSILCLLGLTWCTGLFYMAKSFYAAAYIFTALNGLQGIFIFIFHVLLNEKTVVVFRRLFKMKTITRQMTKSTVFNGTSSERQRTQMCNGTSGHNKARNSHSFNQQKSQMNSASSCSAPVEAISQCEDGGRSPPSRANCAKKCAHTNGLKSLPPGFCKDTTHGRARGVLRQIRRVHNANRK